MSILYGISQLQDTMSYFKETVRRSMLEPSSKTVGSMHNYFIYYYMKTTHRQPLEQSTFDLEKTVLE